MVGLKNLWPLLSALFLFAACVPQTKQTECSSNEAFNAALRSCVPIVQGSSSFINISSFTPQFTQTRSKTDSTMLTFSIAVSNPYNQSYSVEWERVFNAGPTYMCSNSLTCSFPASFLGTTLGEVGTHILTAKIKDGNGAVVDSHSFELKINELPKPTISLPVTPDTLNLTVFPTEPRIPFSFTVRNNGATISASDNYRTVWTVLKNGSAYLTEIDSFTNFTANGSNYAYLGAGTTPAFNPGTFGVGTYSIRASVMNDVPGEIVSEQYWNVIVKQPDLSKISNISDPAPGVTITAHNNINYTQYPTLSWIDTTGTQPDFCVTIDDADGTYASDGKGIQVKFYLNGTGGDICTKVTDDNIGNGSQTICLNDANLCQAGGTPVAFNPSILKFSNSSPSVDQLHKVTARLFDVATSQEFDRSNVTPSNGSYPIEWNVLVKPVNTAPQLSFGTTQPTGCTSIGTYTKANCLVNQNEEFTVSFKVQDDFYNPAIDPAEFQWNVNLKLNGVDVPGAQTACSKAFGTAATTPADSGPYGTQWICKMAVPHYTSSGPLDPSSGSYSIVATMQDNGSPVGGTGLVSQSLNWNLVVTETNPTNIAVNAQTASSLDSHVANGAVILDPNDIGSFATELDTITFRLNINDQELDNFKYQISLCTTNTAACPTSTAITSPSWIDFVRSIQADPDLNPVQIGALAYQLPEDLLLQLSPQLDVDKVTPQLVYFKVEAKDVPSVLVTAPTTHSQIFKIYVRNYNPAPVIDTASASPAINTTSVVYSGYPFTINPGTVTDTGPASETSIVYQWYAKTGAGAWTAITGATAKILRYTPGNITTNIDLKLCVGDRAAANPVSSSGSCSDIWTVTPKKFLENLTATNTTQSRDEIAVWYDDTNPLIVANTQVVYTAYVANDGFDDKIYVEKTIKDTSGNIVKTSTVNFYPLSTSNNSGAVTNLSITGTATSIYVSYLASTQGDSTIMIPRIRRIDKSIESGLREKTAMAHPMPYGFNYDHYSGTSDCGGVSCAQVGFTAGNGIGGFAEVEFTSTLASGNTVTINGYTFTAATTPSAANQICDGTSCADVNSLAINLRDKINNSTDAALQGITAKANGAIVELYGQYHDDYLDFDGSIGLVPGFVAPAGGMGKIFINGARWNLPIIDIVGRQIVVLSGPADQHMRATLPIDTANILTDMGEVASFDAGLAQSGELVFARISGAISDAGRMKLYRYTLSGSTWVPVIPAGSEQVSQDIFGMLNFEYVKLATNAASNNHLYIVARERAIDGGEYHLGRYNPNLDTAVTALEYSLTNRVVTTDSTDDVIDDSKFKAPEVIAVPNAQEARIFFHSVGTGATPYPRVARWRSDDLISCGTCSSLTDSQAILATSKIGVSQIAPSITLGAAGSTAGENTRNLVFTGFQLNTTVDPTVYKPYLGIINTRTEAIQSTSTDSTGLWRPPFVLDQ